MVLTINGHPHELHFGMKALEIFFQTAGNVEEGSLFHAEQITAIVWGGLHNGAYRQQRALPLSFAAVSDWVEEQYWNEEGQKRLAEITAAFNESQAVKKMAELTKVEDGAKKKKRPTSKL